MPALPMIAEAAHILEPFLPIESFLECVKHKVFACGDNIDKTIHRRFLRSDGGNISLHYFHSYAIFNHVDFSHLSDEIPDNSTIHDLKNIALSLQPTALDDQILQNNISTLVSRILCNRIKFVSRI